MLFTYLYICAPRLIFAVISLEKVAVFTSISMCFLSDFELKYSEISEHSCTFCWLEA
jgi:hypothetical protein